MGDSFWGLLFVIASFVLLFLIFRVIVLWYWRVNDIVDRLDSIINELKRLGAETEDAPPQKNDESMKNSEEE